MKISTMPWPKSRRLLPILAERNPKADILPGRQAGEPLEQNSRMHTELQRMMKGMQFG